MVTEAHLTHIHRPNALGGGDIFLHPFVAAINCTQVTVLTS